MENVCVKGKVCVRESGEGLLVALWGASLAVLGPSLLVDEEASSLLPHRQSEPAEEALLACQPASQPCMFFVRCGVESNCDEVRWRAVNWGFCPLQAELPGVPLDRTGSPHQCHCLRRLLQVGLMDGPALKGSLERQLS